MQPAQGGTALAYWRAVATLPVDRAGGSAQLEACFAGAAAPGVLDGSYEGRFLAPTVGGPADRLLSAVTGVWMPWRGKIFDGALGQGLNRFSGPTAPLLPLLFHGQRGVATGRAGETTAFRFLTTLGTSRLQAGVRVMRIDYDLPDNPRWPIRRILDELVTVDDGVYLGQALLRRRDRWSRVAWFSLHSREGGAGTRP
ncbi:MAG: hypothetical protein M3N17_09220 [Actinomycetota bacterium]|nr:hypothetical protein [Actinomycetota bacterium]